MYANRRAYYVHTKRKEEVAIHATSSQSCIFGNSLVSSLLSQVCESVFPSEYKRLEQLKKAQPVHREKIDREMKQSWKKTGISCHKPGIFCNLPVGYWRHTHMATPLEVKAHYGHTRGHGLITPAGTGASITASAPVGYSTGRRRPCTLLA
jgi:hypothetical protein